MTVREESAYRLRLAEDQAARARRLLALDRTSAALLARAAVENAAKAVLGCFSSVARSHEPGEVLDEALASPGFPDALRPEAVGLRPTLQAYGMRRHVELSYGDERARRLPSELVDEAQAVEALDVADRALELARRVRRAVLGV